MEFSGRTIRFAILFAKTAEKMTAKTPTTMIGWTIINTRASTVTWLTEIRSTVPLFKALA